MEIPDYYREEILDMKPELVPLFLSVLGLPTGSNERQRILADLESRGKIKPRMEIPVAGGLQFGDLPPEVQLGILGRVSPTARETAPVSHGMRELADVVLMDNIRSGNLVDPTIGIPERGEYFKVDAAGQGEYFSPEPSLWQNIQKYRTYRLDKSIIDRFIGGDQYTADYIPLLLYGTILGRDGSEEGKFVSFARIEVNLPPSETYQFRSVSPYHETIFSFSRRFYPGEAENDQALIRLTSGVEVGDQVLKLSIILNPLIIADWYVMTRVVTLTNDLVYNGQLILPSLRDGVRLL